MNESRQKVRSYHEATKHHPDAYAPGPGFLDWDSQPDPFRRYAGAPLIPLPLVAGAGRCGYDGLYRPSDRPPAPLTADTLGLFLELALGLSAWKSFGPDRWALRNNPSSGNLHPTEGYLLLWRAASDALRPGLYHYAPHEHGLERRAVLPVETAARLAETLPGTFGALGLASILWREEWKYGARAFRYCQHDVGHALAAARFAAAVQGWGLTLDPSPGDDEVAACLGLDRFEEPGEAEAEHPDTLALLGAPGAAGMTPPWPAIADALLDWRGRPNRLSPTRVAWPQIGRLLPAVLKPPTARPSAVLPQTAAPPVLEPVAADACALIRRRRSAQRMDGRTGMDRAAFERALQRTLPGHPPFDALPFTPAANLVLFVHSVEGVAPGMYALVRIPECMEALRRACATPDLAWTPVDDTPLPLYRLRAPLDLRRTAAALSCHQDIAGQGAFSLGMLADLERVLELEGSWAYRRLYWEAGMIGQVLYLEAEAAGLRGTGIGCFFDDAVHRLLGLDPAGPWQDLYHFTIGGPVPDRRLTTEPAYSHLTDRRFR